MIVMNIKKYLIIFHFIFLADICFSEHPNSVLSDLKIRASNGDIIANAELCARYYDKYKSNENYQIENFDEAIKWCKSASKLDHCLSSAHLASMYYHGTNGININKEKAAVYYVKATQQYKKGDNIGSIVFLRAGDMYFQGDGVTQDYGKAFNLYSQAIEKEATLGEAYYKLATMYENGFFVKKDVDIAKKHYLNSVYNGGCLETRNKLRKIAMQNKKPTNPFGYELGKESLENVKSSLSNKDISWSEKVTPNGFIKLKINNSRLPMSNLIDNEFEFDADHILRRIILFVPYIKKESTFSLLLNSLEKKYQLIECEDALCTFETKNSIIKVGAKNIHDKKTKNPIIYVLYVDRNYFSILAHQRNKTKKILEKDIDNYESL